MSLTVWELGEQASSEGEVSSHRCHVPAEGIRRWLITPDCLVLRENRKQFAWCEEFSSEAHRKWELILFLCEDIIIPQNDSLVCDASKTKICV